MTKKCLAQRVLGDKWFDQLYDSRVYKALIDGFSNMAAGTVLGTMNDYFVAGMEPPEVLRTRLAAIPVHLATGRFYGKCRDAVYRKFHVTDDSGWLKRYVSDVFVFATFITPLYVGFASLAGAESDEIACGATFMTVAAPGIGKASGYANDCIRRAAGMKTSGELSSEYRTDSEMPR